MIVMVMILKILMRKAGKTAGFYFLPQIHRLGSKQFDVICESVAH